MLFLRPSRQMLEEDLKTGHGSLVIIIPFYHHPTYAVENVSLNKLRNM
jgi:hypothetical protein